MIRSAACAANPVHALDAREKSEDVELDGLVEESARI